MCFPAFPSPFDPAPVTAIFPRYPASPFRLKFLPTIRADLLWMPLCHPPLLDLSLIVLDPAPVATKPPPPSCASCPLLHYIATFRTDVYLSFIIPFCVVISVPTLIAAVFLPRYMARWDKAFSTIQAFQFFCHTFTPLLLFYTTGGGALLFDAYLNSTALSTFRSRCSCGTRLSVSTSSTTPRSIFPFSIIFLTLFHYTS